LLDEGDVEAVVHEVRADAGSVRARADDGDLLGLFIPTLS
jgi:hypothetical protein